LQPVDHRLGDETDSSPGSPEAIGVDLGIGADLETSRNLDAASMIAFAMRARCPIST
jgi:hypothetical protein